MPPQMGTAVVGVLTARFECSCLTSRPLHLQASDHLLSYEVYKKYIFFHQQIIYGGAFNCRLLYQQPQDGVPTSFVCPLDLRGDVLSVGRKCRTRTAIPHPKCGVLPLHYILCMVLRDRIELPSVVYKTTVLTIELTEHVGSGSWSRTNEYMGQSHAPFHLAIPLYHVCMVCPTAKRLSALPIGGNPWCYWWDLNPQSVFSLGF